MKIALVRYRWLDTGGSPAASGPWHEETFHEVFASSTNGWSVASYWAQCSFGFLTPEFDLAPPISSPAAPGAPAGWHEWNYDPARVGGSRGIDLSNGIQKALADGAGGYDAYVIFGYPPPCDAGEAGGSALLDQYATLSYYEHEIGHVLGLRHPFGHFDGVKDDPWCVMAYNNVLAFDLTPQTPLADLPVGDARWQASRRPATASLYRYVPAFGASPSVKRAPSPWPLATTPVVIGGPSEHELVAASDAVINVDPLLVASIVELPNNPSPLAGPVNPPGELLFEYRRPKPDDWDRGVGAPTLVIHSMNLARDVVPPENSEFRPVWFEAALAANVGAGWGDPRLDVGVEILDRSPDDKRIKFRLAQFRSMKAGAWIDSVAVTERATSDVETGTTSPAPIGTCALGTYPYTVIGTKATLLIKPQIVGIDSPVFEWSIYAKYSFAGSTKLAGPLDQDLKTKRLVSQETIRNAITKTMTRPVELGYRIGSDGTLTLRKAADAGGFTVKLVLRVTGTNPQFGPVERTDSIDVHFPGDEIVIGGSYDFDRARCLGYLRPIGGVLEESPIRLPRDPGPLKVLPGYALGWGPWVERVMGRGPLVLIAIILAVVGLGLIVVASSLGAQRQVLETFGASILAASLVTLLIGQVAAPRT